MLIVNQAGAIRYAVTAAALLAAVQAQAGQWDPAGGTGDLADPANWTGGFPVPSGNAVFDMPGGSTTATLSLPTLPIGSLSFVAGDTLFQLGGNTLASGGVIDAGLSVGTALARVESGRITGVSLSAGDGAGGQDVTLAAGTGGEWVISGAFTTQSDVTLVLDGGTVSVGSLALSGTLDLQAGTLSVNGDLSWADLGSPASLSLGAGQTLYVDQTLTFGPSDTFALTGGAFTAGMLAGGGTLDFQQGSLTIQNAGLGIGTGQEIAVSELLGAGDSWDLGGALSIESGFGLTVAGGTVVADSAALDGTLAVSGGSATFGDFDNAGGITLTGGTLSLGQLTDNTGGVAVTGPATLRYTGASFDVNPGSVWGDSAYLVSSNSTLQADNAIAVGTTGIGVLTLGDSATVQTATLHVGSDTQLVQGTNSQLLADTIFVESTLDLVTVLGWGVQPWQTSETTIFSDAVLTYAGPGVTTTTTRIFGGAGTVHIAAGTLRYDNTGGQASGPFSTTFQIDEAATLLFEGDSGFVFNNARAISLGAAFGQAAVDNAGTLRIDGQRITFDRPYTGAGSVVLANQAQVQLGASSGTTVIQQLTAPSGTRFARSGSGLRFLHIHDADNLHAQFLAGVSVSLLGEVQWDGGSVADRLEVFGQVTLAQDATITGGSGTTDATVRFIAGDGVLQLGDASRFAPGGTLTVDGQLLGPGAGGSAQVETYAVLGEGEVSAGGGTLTVDAFLLTGFDGTFAGDAGSRLTFVDGHNQNVRLSALATIDSRGDVHLLAPGDDITLNGDVDVDGELYLSAWEIEIGADGLFQADHLVLDARAALLHDSAEPLAFESIRTVEDTTGSSYQRASITTHGDVLIGAGGINAFGEVSFSNLSASPGTVTVGGLIDATALTLFNVTLNANGGIETDATLVPNISLYNATLNLAAGHTLTNQTIHGDDHSSVFAIVNNYGTLHYTQDADGRHFDLNNYGTIVFDYSAEHGDLNATIVNEGVFHITEDGYHGQFGSNFTQPAGGSLVVEGGIRLFSPTLGGTLDFTGGWAELDELTLTPDTAVVTLGDVTLISTLSFLTRTSGSAITVDDIYVTHLLSRSAGSDGIRVRGTMHGQFNATVRIPTIVEGTLAPGGDDVPFTHFLEFRDDLTLLPGSRVELDLRTAVYHDRLRMKIAGSTDLGDGATLALDNDPGLAALLSPGDTLQLIDTSRPMTGAFAHVEGLDLGGGLRWSLSYDATGLIAEARLAGDIDGDGFVGATDLDVLLALWDGPVTAGVGADLSGDGLVGDADLGLVLANWGAGSPGAPNVPEPGSLALILGGLFATRRRRC